MTNKPIGNSRKIGGDYFNLQYSNSSSKKLGDHISQFNFEDYWCFKGSHRQRLTSYEELLEFNHSKYTFFRKDLFPLIRITEWIDWMVNLGGINFLDKPTPPFSPQKVKIIK
jgi:hypothetical protein